MSEKGHAKTVADFKTLIMKVQSFGADYNPSDADLKTSSLPPLAAAAAAELINVNAKAATSAAATNDRAIAFEDLDKLATRIRAALELSPAADLIGTAAVTLVRKLRGERAAPVAKPKENSLPETNAPNAPNAPDAADAPKIISVSHLSYDSQLANFDSLIRLLATQPSYAPNEQELTVAGLRARFEDMRAKNNAAVAASIALDNARAGRNANLYGENGLVEIAADIKKYVKYAFGTDSSQYGQIRDLEFRKPR